MSRAKQICSLFEKESKGDFDTNELKPIKPSPGDKGFPRHAVSSVETRKKDLVVRITNWMKDKDEPAYDVEFYVGGVYDYDESKSFTLSSGLTKEQAKENAIKFAQKQIAKLL